MQWNFYHNIYLIYFISRVKINIKTITEYGLFCNYLYYFKVITNLNLLRYQMVQT